MGVKGRVGSWNLGGFRGGFEGNFWGGNFGRGDLSGEKKPEIWKGQLAKF